MNRLESQSQSAPQTAGIATLGRIAALFAITLAAYSPAISAEFIWNDRDYVTAPALRSWHGLLRIWTDVGVTEQYYPLLHSAFWLQDKLWGVNPAGYHVVNILLHATAALLLVALVRQLRLRGAWLAGFLFALHPVCVESVAWVAEQKNTLSTVFYLAAAWTYLRFDDTRSRRTYAWALGWFVLALLTKSVTATLAPALLVVLWWRQGTLAWRRDVRPLLPWFALGTAIGLFSGWVEHTYVGAQGADFQLNILERTLLAGRAAWFYLGKLVWPANLTFIYPRWNVSATEPLWYFFAGATLLLLGTVFWLRTRWRGPLAAILCYGGCLVPTLGFFNVYAFMFSYVADHWQYMPSLAMFVLAAAGLGGLSDQFAGRCRLIGSGSLVLIVGALGWLTYQQSRMYRDIETFYQATIARNPECWMAHNNLGLLLADRGDVERAMVHYQQALRLRPGFAEARNNFALLLARMPGRMDEALAQYRHALQSTPVLPEVHNNLGAELARLGRHDEAIVQYRRALEIKPGHALVHFNLAAELEKDPRRHEEALKHYQAAVRFDPDFARAHGNLANMLAALPGRLPDAIRHFEEAIRLRPGVALVHNNFANALAQVPGRMNDAIAQYYRALELRPDLAAVHYNLARKLAQIPERGADALWHFKAAAELQPDFTLAHYELGKQLARMPGREREAIAEFQHTVRLDPTFTKAQQELAQLRARLGREDGATRDFNKPSNQ